MADFIRMLDGSSKVVNGVHGGDLQDPIANEQKRKEASAIAALTTAITLVDAAGHSLDPCGGVIGPAYPGWRERRQAVSEALAAFAVVIRQG